MSNINDFYCSKPLFGGDWFHGNGKVEQVTQKMSGGWKRVVLTVTEGVREEETLGKTSTSQRGIPEHWGQGEGWEAKNIKQLIHEW